MYRLLRKCNGIVIEQIKGENTSVRSRLKLAQFTILNSQLPHITRRICRKFVGKSICIAC
jgi:hypothetical protein